MKKIMVTGANGFIGSFLLKELSCNNVEIIAVIKDSQEKVEHIQNLPGIRLVYCDQAEIGHLPDIVVDRDIDICIHLAWAGSFGPARSDYALQLLNVRQALGTVGALASMGVKRFVGIGTLAEMDVLNYHGSDDARPNPVSDYGIAKLTTHFMTKAECVKLGLEHVWCRLSNTYGVGNTTGNFVNMAARLMLGGKRAAFTAATQTYDFVYVTDTVRAIASAAVHGKPFCCYYLGSGMARPLKEFIAIIRDEVDPAIELHLGEVPFQGNPLPPEAYDTRKLFEDTGFVPEVNFENGIKKTVEWLRETEFQA